MQCDRSRDRSQAKGDKQMRAILLAGLVVLNMVIGLASLKADVAAEGETSDWDYPDWLEEEAGS